MNQVKLKEIIQDKKIVIPLYVLRIYKDFNLSKDEIILLIYLFDKNQEVFDPNMIEKDLGYDLLNVMEMMSSLTDKGLINVASLKNENNLVEEKLDLNPFYDIISTKLIEEFNKEEVQNENIHHLIEKEFNRKLSSFEHEMIDTWEKNNYSKDLIREALKEASLNGVNNLRYIDKILLDWTKEGYKTSQDIKNKPPKEEVLEIYNCDWLNDDEDEEI